MLEKYGLRAADILLPDEKHDLAKWAVIACDQFTSQPEYWEKAQEISAGAPSTLNIIYPEAWLDQGDGRIDEINTTMLDYEKSVLTRRVQGMILVERTIATGRRLGLVAAVDLEKYDFSVGSTSMIRATEGTILERIPPRVKIRKNAALELPHILLLADDPERTFIEPLYEQRDALNKVYDVELMLGGGHLRGWEVKPDAQMEAALEGLMQKSDGLLFAVGDGNHSLATARQCWLNLREPLTEEERANHPARYALVEINNLHDEALVFEPIHRVIFGANRDEMIASFAAWLGEQEMSLIDCADDQAMLWWTHGADIRPMRIGNCKHPLPLAVLQKFLDENLPEGAKIDYIHGADAVEALTDGQNAAGHEGNDGEDHGAGQGDQSVSLHDVDAGIANFAADLGQGQAAAHGEQQQAEHIHTADAITENKNVPE